MNAKDRGSRYVYTSNTSVYGPTCIIRRLKIQGVPKLSRALFPISVSVMGGQTLPLLKVGNMIHFCSLFPVKIQD